MKTGLENDLFWSEIGSGFSPTSKAREKRPGDEVEDLGNQAAHPNEEFPAVLLHPGFCGIYPAVSPICHATASFPRLCSDVTSHVVTLTFSVQVTSRTTNEQQNYFYDFYLHKCIDLTLYRLIDFSVVVCSSGCFQGPPLPNKPFITVWNTPTDRCEPEWNVSLDLSAFDIVVNKDQKWCGEYIVIFYNTQLGLYPYFDSNGKTFNGGVPQVHVLQLDLLL